MPSSRWPGNVADGCWLYHFSWVNQRFLWPFPIATLNYQRVCSMFFFRITGDRENHIINAVHVFLHC
jgi:hypothetical protein